MKSKYIFYFKEIKNIYICITIRNSLHLQRSEKVLYAIEYNTSDKQYVGEARKLLKVRVKEHREEVDTQEVCMHFIRGTRKESEREKYKSAIKDHVVKENPVMDWDSALILQIEREIRVHAALIKHLYLENAIPIT